MAVGEKIPRIIHYCWFGRAEKPKLVKKCMASWKKHLGDYKIIEWNEDNFDINSNLYIKQAYELKKFAFVSDYARLYALCHYGGIYLDTDVEIMKSLDPFLIHSVFSGFEDDKYLQSAVMGAVKGHSWIKKLLDYYQDKKFILADGTYDMTTNTKTITGYCTELGLIPNGKQQVLYNGLTIYPRTFFSPFDYINGGNYITNESYAIHHFAKSWLPLHVRMKSKIKVLLSRFIGPKMISDIRNLVRNR